MVFILNVDIAYISNFKINHIMSSKRIINGIVLPVVTFIIGSFLYDWFKQIPFASSILSICDWLLSVLNFRIQLWIIIILFISFIIATRFLIKANYTPMSESTNDYQPVPLFLNYKEDLFGVDKSKWRWDYGQRHGKYAVENVRPICKICNGDLALDTYTHQSGYCSRCNLEGNSADSFVNENINDVRVEIYRRIKEKYNQ
jgi:hypothetical protein